MYAKIKDGRVVTVWSDNEDEETMSVHEKGCYFEPTVDICETVGYSDIIATDNNAPILEMMY